MEIKTVPNPREEEWTEAAPRPAPEKGRYLRRKSPQKLRRSRTLGPRLRAILPALGKTLVLLAAAAFLVSVFTYAYTSDKFRVATIALVGTKQAQTDRLERVIREAIPENLLAVDLAKVRNVVERDPWVRRAEIRRVLPSKLVVYIEERIPSAILEIRGELQLADADGILLDRYDPRQAKLDVPVFKGFLGDAPDGYRLYQDENSARVRTGRRLLEELEGGSPAFSRSLSEVDLSDPANVRVLLVDDTAEISIGDRDFLKRFRTLMSNLPQYQELRTKYSEIASIDLRFDGQIVYRPRRAAPQPPEASGAPSPAPTLPQDGTAEGAPPTAAPPAPAVPQVPAAPARPTPVQGGGGRPAPFDAGVRPAAFDSTARPESFEVGPARLSTLATRAATPADAAGSKETPAEAGATKKPRVNNP